MRQFFLIMVLFSFLIPKIGAQSDTTRYEDLFKLKSGLIFKGRIIHFDDQLVEIERENGQRLRFGQKDFEWMKQAQFSNLPSGEKKFIMKSSKRFFGSIDLGAGFGGTTDGFLSGLSVDAGLIYRLYSEESNHFAGLNTGFDTYNAFRPFSVVPLTMKYQYSHIGTQIAPLVYLSSGYAFATGSENQAFFGFEEKAYGGLKWEAGAGFIFRTSDKMAMKFTGSFISQRNKFVSTSEAWGSSEVNQHIKRIFLKFGLIF